MCCCSARARARACVRACITKDSYFHDVLHVVRNFLCDNASMLHLARIGTVTPRLAATMLNPAGHSEPLLQGVWSCLEPRAWMEDCFLW